LVKVAGNYIKGRGWLPLDKKEKNTNEGEKKMSRHDPQKAMPGIYKRGWDGGGLGKNPGSKKLTSS